MGNRLFQGKVCHMLYVVFLCVCINCWWLMTFQQFQFLLIEQRVSSTIALRAICGNFWKRLKQDRFRLRPRVAAGWGSRLIAEMATYQTVRLEILRVALRRVLAVPPGPSLVLRAIRRPTKPNHSSHRHRVCHHEVVPTRICRAPQIQARPNHL